MTGNALWLFIACLLTMAMAACVLWRRASLRLRRIRSETDLAEGSLNACEVAWLRAGDKRALMVAAAGLLHQGGARVVEKGNLARTMRMEVTGADLHGLMPLQEAMEARLALYESGATWDQLSREMAGPLAELRESLTALGLAVPQADRAREGNKLCAILSGGSVCLICCMHLFAARADAVPAVAFFSVFPLLICVILRAEFPVLTDAGKTAGSPLGPQARFIAEGGTGEAQMTVMTVASTGESALTGRWLPLAALIEESEGD